MTLNSLNNSSEGNIVPNSSAVQRMLQALKPIWDKTNVSEILINKPFEVWTEEDGKFIRHEIPEISRGYLQDITRLIANESHQTFNSKNPLLSANLYDGSRIQCVHTPTALDFSLAIRRQVVKNFTLDDYHNQNFYTGIKKSRLEVNSFDDLLPEDQELLRLYTLNKWNEFIRLAIHTKKNIMVSGGTSSGKTTFLNACLREIDREERIITLEDVREVNIPHPNKVQLCTSKGQQGEAKITMQDLVQCCLRLRPDRIIMGEIRGGEIMDFINSCSTGHEGSITSIHANNPNIAFMRMVQMYKLNNVPSMTNEDILAELKQIIDVIIQVGKRPDGSRGATGIYYRYQHLPPIM